MKKIINYILYSLSFASLLALLSCSVTGADDLTTLSGSVVDPEIRGAQIKVISIDGTEEIEIQEGSTTTDRNGNFNIKVKFSEGKNPEDFTIVASNGHDVESGEELKTPLKVVIGKKLSRIIASPITSLIVEAVKEGNSLDEAKLNVAEVLGTDITVDNVEDNPVLNNRILRVAILVNKIANSVGNKQEAFKRLLKVLKNRKQQLKNRSFTEALEGAETSVILDDLELEGPLEDRAAIEEDIKETAKVVKDQSNVEDIRKSAKKSKIVKALKKAYGRNVIESALVNEKVIIKRGINRIANRIAKAIGKIKKKEIVEAAISVFVDVDDSVSLNEFRTTIQSIGAIDNRQTAGVAIGELFKSIELKKSLKEGGFVDAGDVDDDLLEGNSQTEE